jgi:ABC-type glycerol-3-phosphate transport system substrate-binding protein
MDNSIVQPLIDEYTATYPNVTIEYANIWPIDRPFAEAEEMYQDTLNETIQDELNAADIFMVHNSWAGDYEAFAQPSVVYPVETFRNSFYPAAATDLITNGSVYGVPLWMDTYAIVYNEDMLSAIQKTAPDQNWSAFKVTAEELTSQTGNVIEQSGFAAGLTTNIEFFFQMVVTLMRQNGVVLTDENRSPVFSSDPAAADAITFFKSFTTGTSQRTWDNTFSNESAAFLEEKVAMIMVPSWRLREILRANENYDLGLNIGIASLPQVIGQESEINWADYWAAMVSNKSLYSVEAWNFLYWLTQPEQLEKLHENSASSLGFFGTLYPRSDMSDRLVDDEYLSVYNRSLQFAESWYMVKGRQIKELFAETISGSTVGTSQLERLEEDIKLLQVQKGTLDVSTE